MAGQFNPVYRRKIKAIAGNGTGSLIITPTAGKRLYSLQLQITYAGGTNTLAALMTALTEIRVLTGTKVRWRLSGTQLRDFCLHRGTTYDFNGLPNTGAQVTIPFAPEWFIENVADSLAWNPALLGAPITVEIDSTASLTVVAIEAISDNLDAPSSGILTLEVIKPTVGGVETIVSQPEIELRGALVSAHIYPDTTNSSEITPASLLVGRDERYVHEEMSSAQNDEALERMSLTPAATGRTANIYDIVMVKGDQLSKAVPLGGEAKAQLKIGGAALGGTCSILLCRLE